MAGRPIFIRTVFRDVLTGREMFKKYCKKKIYVGMLDDETGGCSRGAIGGLLGWIAGFS